MTHRAVNDNALRPEVSHHRRHRVRARMVSLRMVRGQWPWTETSSASRVRGATRPLLGIALGRAGRRHDRAAGAGLRCGHPDARIWSCQVSAAWLVRLQWVHRCSPPWARWRRPHQGHKRCVGVCSSSLFYHALFHLAGPPFCLFFTLLYMFFLRPSLSSTAPDTLQSLGLSVRSITCLLVLPVRVPFLPSSHGSHFVFLCCCTKMSSFHPVILFIVVAAFFLSFPLKYI